MTTATIMLAETDGRWQVAEPGRRCRARVNQPTGLWYACGKPAVFKLNRRNPSAGASGHRAREYKPLWYGYCADMDHCYHRVLCEGTIYFVYQEDLAMVERIIKAMRERAT